MNNPEKVKALRDGTAGNRRTYWTPEAINTLTNMFYDQVGITEMAVHFDRSERAIMNQLDKLGLYACRQQAQRGLLVQCMYNVQRMQRKGYAMRVISILSYYKEGGKAILSLPVLFLIIQLVLNTN